MGCNCGGGARGGGSRAYAAPPRPAARKRTAGPKPAKGAATPRTLTSADFVVYQRDGSKRRYPGDAAGERAAVSYAATHGLSVDKEYKKDLEGETWKNSNS